MCGMVGIFSYGEKGEPIDREELLVMRESMLPRGPDGAGLWIPPDRRVGLAHRRLAILDLSEAGAQPMSTPDGKFWIVFNGEIYNFPVLRKELEKKGYIFRSNCDTEALLYLYQDLGPEMVHALRGMYAFAIYDATNKSLFIARDPLGIKPLYYSDNGSEFRFASQVKALLRSERIGTDPQPAGHVGFFLFGYVPSPFTLFRKISNLPAGARMRVDSEGVHGPEPFFNLTDEFQKAVQNNSGASLKEIQESVKYALRDSVSRHLLSDVPVGVFLSSGLDSSSITGFAVEAGNSNLQTITLGFREYLGTQNDETMWAERISKHFHTSHQTHWVERKEFRGDFARVLHSMDQPSIDGVNTYFVSKVAAEAGMKVALSGLGGDEIFGGYPSFLQIPKLMNLFQGSSFIPRLGKAFRVLTAPVLSRFTSPKYAGIFEYSRSYEEAYLLRRGLFMPWELPDFLDPDMVRTGWNDLNIMLRLKETFKGVNNHHLIISLLEASWYMRNQLLRDTDWAGMAHSVEIRVPLVDVELLRNLGPFLAQSKHAGKRLMTDALENPLPEEVRTRIKTGFTVPIREWLLEESESGRAERGLRSWAKLVYSAQNCF